MLYTYSIIPMDMEHFDEIVEDLVMQYEKDISTCPLFMLLLHAEGIPVQNKVDALCERYMRFKTALDARGVPSGILVQSSLGHGYKLNAPLPFTAYKNLSNGEESTVSCPQDDRLKAYFKDVMKKLAACHPKAIMLDDDFRLLHRDGNGCACELHMAEFNRRAGTQMTREELYDYILSHPDDDPLTQIYVDTQRDSLHDMVVAMREGIDEVDPTIQGINCAAGAICEFVDYNNAAFKGEGNPSIVRVSNGIYAPHNSRQLSRLLARGVRAADKLNGKVDILLGETDTIPFNRYGKCSAYLHAQMILSILAGCRGSKHWITRTTGFEEKSGRAYRKVLAENAKLYEKLADLVPQLRFVGACTPFERRDYFQFSERNCWSDLTTDFASAFLERIGVPIYFADQPDGPCFLNGNAGHWLSRGYLEKIFAENSVFLSADCIDDLLAKGLGDQIGVIARTWEGLPLSGEVYEGTYKMPGQYRMRELVPTADGVYADSYVYHKKSETENVNCFPGTAVYPREGGKYTVTFAGTPSAPFDYSTGFSFLNETRKRQIVSLLKMCGSLPVYYSGDAEVMVSAGYLSEDELLVFVWNLGYDVLEEFPIVTERSVTGVSYFDGNGDKQPVTYQTVGEETTLNIEVRPLYPTVLSVKL